MKTKAFKLKWLYQNPIYKYLLYPFHNLWLSTIYLEQFVDCRMGEENAAIFELATDTLLYYNNY